MDGEEDVIIWASDKLDNRFDCKDLDWVKANGPKKDYIGTEISQDDKYTYMSMCQYIANCLDIVSGMVGIPVDKFTPCATPMAQQIDATSSPLELE